MMPADRCNSFGQTSDDAFDRMFLQMMIGHHQGAVTMARAELSDGQNPGARQLAQRIIDAQQREITEMQAFRSGWGPARGNTSELVTTEIDLALLPDFAHR